MPVRRPSPVVVPRTSQYGHRHDYGIDDSIDRMGYISNSVLEDTYEAATKSRNRDHELLRNANAAIVSTEQHVSPRVAAVSRRVRASTAPPAPRPAAGQQSQSTHVKVADVRSAQPILVLPPSYRSASPSRSNPTASKPVVRSGSEVPWLVNARAGSVAPREYDARTSLPPRPRRASYYGPVAPEPMPTAKLRAHRPSSVNYDLMRNVRARSMEPTRGNYYSLDRSVVATEEPISRTNQLWAHRPMPLRKNAALAAKARESEAASSTYPRRFPRAISEPRNVNRASNYYYSMPESKERALNRYLYAHRGRFGQTSVPQRPNLGDFPQVYVPWAGPGPSNRAKAAIIGSRLESASDAGGAPRKVKRPRSQFAANKLRELKMQDLERRYK